MAQVGLPVLEIPMRGGTDGATLSFKGLPCPNLGTGGFAYHGVHEHITVEGMEVCTRLIVALVEIYAEREKA
jgi:tripeptide aminopeptidase